MEVEKVKLEIKDLKKILDNEKTKLGRENERMSYELAQLFKNK